MGHKAGTLAAAEVEEVAYLDRMVLVGMLRAVAGSSPGWVGDMQEEATGRSADTLAVVAVGTKAALAAE